MKKLKHKSLYFILLLLTSVYIPLKAQSNMIYIDSVPSGANIYLYNENDLNFEKPIGVTPLSLKASEYPNKSFLILMDIGKYVEKVNSIYSMAEWISELNDNIFGEAYTDYHDFTFGTSQVIKLMSEDNQEMFAIGPIFDIQWPTQNRICILFIPSTVSYSSFYSLMPKKGTFKLPSSDSWAAKLMKYGFSIEHVNEARECLSRCGCYFARIKDPKTGEIINYTLILNDKTSGEMLSYTVKE